MHLCDVTLREGDQMPGREYDADQKIRAGEQLASLGVPYIQAGFPVTGPKDRTVIETLSRRTDAKIVGLCRAVEGDVDAALEADADVVEVFAPLGSDQLDHVVDRSRDEMLEATETALDRAAASGVETHLSLIDAFRTEQEHLLSAFDRFSEVTYITLADTVGARTPASVEPFLTELAEQVDRSRIGVHFHDDLGVATANAQTAYEVGVGKADVSVASLGERAGNSALEAVVAIAELEYGDSLGVDRSRLVPACRRVLDCLDESIDPRRALLGEAVTTHESGLHTAAMLDEPSTFEAFDPALFGGERTLVFGEGSGRGAARRLLERVSIDPTDQRIDQFLDALTEQGPLDTEAALALADELFDDHRA